ncbi:ammonium transporter [Gorillibacterium timonense]|uniref:ammonium transporter n=1 Tax=Gorillibacterium timonense TaxID=1689269 RepID=UPI00071E4F79|nr:ammonium transporter [Gorillibacterium timonense]
MWKKVAVTAGALTLLFPTLAFADGVTNEQLATAVNSLWVMLGAILVIFMQGGFALLEAGSTRMKNAGHVAGKTVLTFGLASIAFWAVGFGLAFGNGNGFLGTTGFFTNVTNLAPFDTAFGALGLPISVLFLFQLAFAGVSLAIVWGGFAERAKLTVYFVFGVLYIILIYPFAAHWVWGGGWLSKIGMLDFAGSTVVHLQGATAALVGTIMLKPRIGKFNKDGSPNLIPGHNQVLTVLGVIILWICWFGFNAGSTVSALVDFGYVAVTTNLAAAAGAVATLIISWIYFGKADVPAMLNGVLAALVAITAACAFVTPWAAVVIGAVAGVFTFYTSVGLEKLGLDDPIYAFSVHGLSGVWGTISIGLFATKELAGEDKAGLFYGGGLHQLGVQALGVVGTFAFVAILSFVILYIIKKTIGLRVTEEEELIGLDLSEHGNYGYPEQLHKAQDQTSSI